MKGKGTKMNRVLFPAPNVERPENLPDFYDVYSYIFSPKYLCLSLLFSTICWILESSCSLFEDGILALRRKTDSLFIKNDLLFYIRCLHICIPANLDHPCSCFYISIVSLVFFWCY